MPNERRLDDVPFELTVTAAERWHRDGLDAPLLVVLLEVFEPRDDIVEAADRAPVTLGREVDDQVVGLLEDVGPSKATSPRSQRST